MGVTYDTGALIAADRGERRMWARHGACWHAARSRSSPHPWSPSPGAEPAGRH